MRQYSGEELGIKYGSKIVRIDNIHIHKIIVEKNGLWYVPDVTPLGRLPIVLLKETEEIK